MKKNCIFLLVLIIVAMTINSCLGNGSMCSGLGQEDKLMYRFIDREGQRLGKKYHMSQCCTGLSGMDKVWQMALSFQRYGIPLTEKEARILIINCVDDFVKAINQEEQIRQYLRDYPFSAKNIDMAIYNFGKDNNEALFPFIAVVSNSKNKITYFTLIKDKLQYHTEKFETYDEAVAILQIEKENPTPK